MPTSLYPGSTDLAGSSRNKVFPSLLFKGVSQQKRPFLYLHYVTCMRSDKRKYVILKMVMANTFKGQKSAVILYSQCDATVQSQQRHPILKNRNPIQTKSQKPNPILKNRNPNPNEIQSYPKITGIRIHETVKQKMLPENIALLLRGIFLLKNPLP